MKNKVMAILRWCVFGIMAFMAFAMLLSGAVVTAVCWAAVGALIMPIEPIQKLRKQFNLKRGMTIGIAVALLFVGSFAVPETKEEPISSPESTEEFEESKESDEPSDKTEDPKNEVSTGNSLSSTPNQGDSNESNVGKSPETPAAKPDENPVLTISPVGMGAANPIGLSSIPAFSGSAYITVQNNQPNFSATELTTVGYESYSVLDQLGRCGMAIASCGKEIMPAEGEERGSISSIKPTGWVQAQYSRLLI